MLQTLELFSDLTAHECEDVERIAQRMSVRRSEIIFSQGEFSRDFYIVESGQVEIQVKTAMSDVQTVAILKNGDIFGEMALFDKHSARSATARSMLNTTLFRIPGEAFEKLLKEKPGISFKLLGALSRRLKATTAQLWAPKTTSTPQECRVVLVGAPRNGVGKTTCAISLAHLLSQEAEKKVLFIDLDLWFADATYFLGTYSLKSILDILENVHSETIPWETLSKFIVPTGQKLFTLPGPTNIIDGERLNRENLTKVIKAVRSHFDFVVIDTDCRIDEVFLTAVDMADHVFFLVDANDMYAVKSSARYFQGFSRLNFPENRMTLLASRCSSDFDLTKSHKIFKYPVRGILPQMESYAPEYGKTAYQLRPNDPYLGVFRRLLRDQFQVPMRGLEEKGFLARIFSGENNENAEAEKGAGAGKLPTQDPNMANGNIRVLLKYIRANMVSGQLEEAKTQTLRLLSYCQDSALAFVTLGEILIQENQFSEAIDAFRKALDLEPQNHLALGHLAALSNDDAGFATARQLLEKKIEKTPNWPDLYTDLGELLVHRKEFTEAAKFFRKALTINPRYIEARLYLGNALGEAGRYEEAVSALLENFQPTVRGYYLLGTFLHKLGRYSEALEAFSYAEKVNPRYFDLAEKLDEIKTYLDRITNLIEMHREVMRDHPNFPDLHLKIGNLLALIGKRSEAEKSFREALRLNPNYSEAKKELDQLLALPDYSSNLSKTSETHGTECQCRAKVCHGLKTEVLFGTLPKELQPQIENHQLVVINVRTQRRKQVTLTAAMLEKGSVELDLDHVCPAEEYDILLFEVVNPTSGVVLTRHLHLMENLTGDQANLKMNLSRDLAKFDKSVSPVVPVRYFLTNVRCQALVEAMTGPKPVRVWVSNPRLGLKVEGMVNPEIEGEAHFVLVANEQNDVVQAGDSLHLEVLGADESQRIDVDIPVEPEDISSYRKMVGQPWTRVITLQLREWKSPAAGKQMEA